MIYTDLHDYPVDKTLDGGDSCVRNSILWVTDHEEGRSLIPYLNNGSPIRYPVAPPWTNPKNMTRDNLITLLAAHSIHPCDFWSAKIILIKLIKRFCFCFNSERDYPGTTKRPWPHKMTGGDPKDEGKWRMFDFADFMFPNHMWVAMSAAKVWWRWPLYPICLAFHLLFLVGHSLGNHNEENQMWFECLVFKTDWLYKRINWRWKKRNRAYWESRTEGEYAYLMEEKIGDK